MSEFQDVSPVSPQGMGVSPHYAGFWWRFLASFIDGLIVQGVGCLIGLGLGFFLMAAMISTGGDETTNTVLQGTMNLISLGVGCVLSWLYFALMESSHLQATLGKKICRLQVTDVQGERLTFARATGRYFGKYLSALPCFVGYIMAAFTEKKQALHDMVASTLVVKKQLN